mmetsp:Transcript_18138/g.46433  ORF Transcript_18138/g.46433 Transcript_18138/m.46433 type:complete len:276 (-) Transcript_18138:1201-2028(-)
MMTADPHMISDRHDGIDPFFRSAGVEGSQQLPRGTRDSPLPDSSIRSSCPDGFSNDRHFQDRSVVGIFNHLFTSAACTAPQTKRPVVRPRPQEGTELQQALDAVLVPVVRGASRNGDGPRAELHHQVVTSLLEGLGTLAAGALNVPHADFKVVAAGEDALGSQLKVAVAQATLFHVSLINHPIVQCHALDTARMAAGHHSKSGLLEPVVNPHSVLLMTHKDESRPCVEHAPHIVVGTLTDRLCDLGCILPLSDVDIPEPVCSPDFLVHRDGGPDS